MKNNSYLGMFSDALRRVGKNAVTAGIRLGLMLGLTQNYQPLPWLNIDSAGRSDSSKLRWDAIRKEIKAEYTTALDIGSSLGYFTFKLAELGIECTGIESRWLSYKLSSKIKDLCSFRKAAFIKKELNPANVHSLPEADIVICLSVFHHFVRNYGFDSAKQMLRMIIKKTKSVLFFETGQSDEKYMGWAQFLPEMGDMPQHWIERFLYEIGAARVKHLGTFDTHLGGVKRHLFAAFK